MPDAAMGLPDRTDMSRPEALVADTDAVLVRQLHDADRAGLHEDLRIGTPSGLQSWAVPKGLPEEPGVKRLAVLQPLHRWSYKDFQGRLGHGYGKGVVKKLEESPVVVLKSSPDHLVFTRGDSKSAPVYHLRRTSGKDWLLFISKPGQPVEVKSYPKEHFRQVDMDEVPGLVAGGAGLSRKIDGAGVLAYLGKGGISAYGIRNGADGGKPEYTDIIGGLRGAQVPEDLQGTMLRGEVFGRRAGRSIGANELSGILNSTVMNAYRKRKGDGIRLLIAALAVNKDGRDIYDQELVNRVVARLGHAGVVPMRRYYGKEALDVLERMKAGKDQLTHEGVVLHPEKGRPLKAKFKDDADVVIRGIFKADAGGVPRAGGFEYSLPGQDAITGRVGTGFSHAMLQDMYANPDRYIGRLARIHSQEQYPSGAYRAPGFVAMKDD